MNLIKPSALKRGDKIATVSLSWGGAGDKDILWRYKQGKKRIEDEFGLEVIEMENTLKGSEYIYNHPEKRAQDLMNAFKDKSIKGIFSCIGGDDSIRMLPYIDFNIIKENPKILLGYSDTTIAHLISLKAGISSFYGPSVLAEFAENVNMFEYTKYWFEKAIFEITEIGNINSSKIWTSEYLPWEAENKKIKRKVEENKGYEVLQGKGIVRGHLIGGCIDVLEVAKGTNIWPPKYMWKDSIIFFETSEEKPEPIYFESWLRNYAAQGIFSLAKGIIFGKPYDNKYYDEYKKIILKVIKEEEKLYDLAVMCNVSFGHTAPIITIPYGCLAQLDCDKKEFAILESGVCI